MIPVFNTDPTLMVGLSGFADWSTEFPFIDLFRQARPWFAHVEGQWSTMEYQELKDEGYLDANGWPLVVPPGMQGVRTVWAMPSGISHGSSNYVLTYDGTGTLTLGNVPQWEITLSEAGRIEFTHIGEFWLNITATDPGDTGDYIRNIKIIPAEFVALAEAGEIFNPDFLNAVKDFRGLRFMDWMHTNHSPQIEWTDRPKVNDAMWSRRGVPMEIMVSLANKVGCDPWFCMPHMATNEYIENFATYVRDNLNPDLVVTAEYSNETWNFGFGQFTWLAEQAETVWGVSGGDAWIQYSAKRATETALIWDEVFGAEASTRLYNVIGVMRGWQGLSEIQVNAELWETEEPENFVAPASVFDGMAVTTYFGGPHTGTGGYNVNITIADPAVVTHSGGAKHEMIVGEKVRFYTTGALPTGVSEGVSYYVKETPTEYAYTFSETLGGPAVATSGSQSGTQSTSYRYRLELIEQIEANTGDMEPVYDWLTDRLLNRTDIDETVPRVEDLWASFRTFADSVGLELIAYEGGSHEHHLFGVDISQDDIDKLTTFYVVYSYSPQIATVYEAMWEAWAEIGDGPFVQFGFVGVPGSFGSFSMLRTIQDTANARAVMLYNYNATFPSWFGTGGGDQYLHETVDQLEDGETATFTKRGGLIIGDGYNGLATDTPLSEFALSRNESGHLHVGDLELRDFRGHIVFPAAA